MKKAPKKGKSSKKGGRPSKYSPSILQKARQYIEACEDEVTEFWKTRGEKSNSYDRLVEVKLPTVQGLALHLNVHRDTIQEWAEQHKPFSVTLDKLMSVQAIRLMQNGLSGNYNPQMAKFLLSANHGMREKTDVTTDDKPLPQPIINVHRDNSNEED